MKKALFNKKSLIALSLSAAILGAGVLVACDGEEEPVENTTTTTTTTATYSITLPETSTIYTISTDKTTAEEGETVTLTIELTDNINYGIESVKYNSSNCTQVDETTYTFVMPASDVTISVTTIEYEEVTSNNGASFRATMPNKVAKAQESDASWANDSFYIDFDSTVVNPSVTITSSNENVIPTDALTLYSTGGDGSYVTYLYYRLYLSAVEIGTTYLTFNITSSYNGYSATLVKKIEVVEYGEDLYDETWSESITLKLASSVTSTYDYSEIRYQLYDTNRQYSSTIGTATTVTPEASEHTINFTYVPNHEYYISAYVVNSEGRADTYLTISEVVSGSGGQCIDNYLTFTQEDVSLTLTVSL